MPAGVSWSFLIMRPRIVILTPGLELQRASDSLHSKKKTSSGFASN